MKRVLTLYRVSTKSQVDPKDDIPVQRRECMDFIAQHKDWQFWDERLEKGVSGYKVSAEKRDVIVEIRALAEKKQFDILLVFMFDRLGRREDETPFLVQWFIEHGIEVWSTREGQQRLDNRVDKLLNFMRYWQAGGESEKTSMRVKAAHMQMTRDGIWRGGSKPYGYKLIHTGRTGKKNRQLYDLAIDEEQAAKVIEVFRLSTREGYGNLRIANYMNEHYPDPNKLWTARTVNTMLKNPIYTGRMHMKDIVSEPIESLRIVSDSDFAFASYAMKNRIQSKYPLQRNAENAAMPYNAKTKASAYGATLLSGLLYCAHCGHKLVGSYCTKQLSYGAYHRPIYRCYNGSVKAKECDGQRVYSAARIEEAVMEIVHQYFQGMQKSIDEVWQERTRRQMRSQCEARLRIAQGEYDKLMNQQKSLREEILKSITGTSAFDTGLLNSMLAENEAAIAAAEKTLTECREERENQDAHFRRLAERIQQINDWAQIFDVAWNDAKKMILARLIERIEVSRDYHLTIKFFVTYDDFRKAAEGEEVTIEESRNCYDDFAC